MLRRVLGEEYPFLTGGMGIPRSAATLRQYLGGIRPRSILFTGTAGQLDPGLPMGTVVSPRVCTDLNGKQFSNDLGILPSREIARIEDWVIVDKGLTVARPVATRRQRLQLFRETGAAICDMESTGILEVAYEQRIYSLVVKVVSDTAESGLKAYWVHFRRNMETLAATLSRITPLLASRGPRNASES